MITLQRLAKAVRDPRRAIRLALQALLFRRGIVHPIAKIVGPFYMARLAGRVLDDHGHDAARMSVLVLDRLYFEKDVDILRSKGRLNYITLHTHVLSVTQEAWLPKDAQVQVDYVLARGLMAEVGWITCEAYAAAIIDRAVERYDIKAVLASNVDYWQHEGFRRACKAKGLPFLVLNQELQTVRSVYRQSVDWYRRTDFRFAGDGCAVFGRATADMLVEGKACTREQLAITGAPRLDPWLDGSVTASEQDTITLLAFEGDQYLAPECYRDALLAFAEASNGGRLRFVLKAKDAEDEAKVRAMLAGRQHRLIITHDEPLTSLFPRSRLVIGYLSIAVMEALFSDAMIAVPNWGDANKSSDELNLDPGDAETARLIAFLPDVQALRAHIDAAERSEAPMLDHEARANLVFRFFHRPGAGGATAEVEVFITKHIRAKP